jgi:hypothetical protein
MRNLSSRRLRSHVLFASILCAGALPAMSPAAEAPPLRIDGIGPLKLGMRQNAAVATGWLAGRTLGCELAGPNRPIVYKFSGPKAPAGIDGTAEFSGGKLQTLSFSKGVTTTKGVVAGVSTIKQMLARYRTAPFSASARFDTTFVGTFVTVHRGSRSVMGGFGEKKIVTLIGIPAVPVCE